MKKGSKAVHIVLNVILWVVIVIAACFSILTFASKSDAGVANIGGYTPMTVLSDSMVPTFSSGDLIIVHEVADPASLQEGDIIAFWTLINNQRVINTHRIAEVVTSGDLCQFVTKSDANEREDNLLVSPGDIIGVYSFKIPVLGQVLEFISSSIGFLLIIVLPLLVFFIWQLYRLITLVVEMKKEAVREASAEEKARLEAEIREKIKAEEAAKLAERRAYDTAAETETVEEKGE